MSNSGIARGIFRRIFVLYVVIMAAAVVFIEVYITDTVRENYIADLTGSLATQARLVAKTLPQRMRPLDVFCRETRQVTGARVTIIAPDGVVLGDSDHDSQTMENHAHREEIQQAGLNGTGSSVRFSHTL